MDHLESLHTFPAGWSLPEWEAQRRDFHLHNKEMKAEADYKARLAQLSYERAMVREARCLHLWRQEWNNDTGSPRIIHVCANCGGKWTTDLVPPHFGLLTARQLYTDMCPEAFRPPPSPMRSFPSSP